ncbi:MAG: 2-oxoacid:acceptor oxidoreductase family protein [Deltaproteobacteria bacterium]|nr:2-oxoacid:acceptor oxidoreductase family protein [Deltaproteobacteria bacterium]
MVELKQVRLCGFGGQGIILAGVILGYAAISDGKWVAGSSSYGAQARGGYARSDVVISEEPIVFPHVIEADILIAMAQTAYERYIEDSTTDAVVLFDEGMVSPRTLDGVKQVGISATSCAIEELDQKQVANIVILGAAVAITGVVSKEALVSAIKENVDERFRDLNLKTVEAGFALGGERWRLLEGRTGQS